MWKKEDLPPTPSSPQPERNPRAELSVSSGTGARVERATIGRSITIRGDVTGDEDLLIQGRVEGSIDLKQHAVTIGSEGEVKANIVGRTVIVEGGVEGDIKSEEQVVLRSTARVLGDITAPRLVLEDGARFRGGIDMGVDPEPGRSGASSAQSQPKRSAAATPPAPSSEGPAKEGESAADANGARRKGAGDVVAEAKA